MATPATLSALELFCKAMNKVTAEIYQLHPDRYILVSGQEEGAPTCPYENVQQWVGYDTLTKEYIRFTKSVYKKLVEELNELERVQRPAISKQIGEARDKGDLSENAEYDAAKEAQGMLEMKISLLKETIASARLIDESKINTNEVQIMTRAKIKNTKTGQIMTYMIVSESEANLKEGKAGVHGQHHDASQQDEQRIRALFQCFHPSSPCGFCTLIVRTARKCAARTKTSKKCAIAVHRCRPRPGVAVPGGPCRCARGTAYTPGQCRFASACGHRDPRVPRNC